MKEDFLHYVWKFKKFDTSNLYTSNQESITIIHSGDYLQLAGPDFFNAQVIIDGQKWAGNVEIHLNSSDWYHHHHEKDMAYENVILHVVWEHDAEIFRKDNTEIPVLELRHYIAKETVENYRSLLLPKSWIFCERQLQEVDVFIFEHWLERLFFERLERKSRSIDTLLAQTHSDWEAVLFCLLAKNFGLNTNGEIFLKIAASIPFAIIRKERTDVKNLEALFFGTAGLLDVGKEDHYFKSLKEKFDYLVYKYRIQQPLIEPVQFFKHRPDNFPTVRLSQLASLYFSSDQLFSKIIAATCLRELYEIFNVSVSEYWKTHYQFDRESPKKRKSLSQSFIDLIIINTIVPVKFAYAKSHGKEISEALIALLRQIPAEHNAVIQKFRTFGVAAANAFDSQCLLQLKKEYCERSRCMECAVGIELLKSNPIKV